MFWRWPEVSFSWVRPPNGPACGGPNDAWPRPSISARWPARCLWPFSTVTFGAPRACICCVWWFVNIRPLHGVSFVIIVSYCWILLLWCTIWLCADNFPSLLSHLAQIVWVIFPLPMMPCEVLCVEGLPWPTWCNIETDYTTGVRAAKRSWPKNNPHKSYLHIVITCPLILYSTLY